MLIIPAIDLKDGKCVRLRQGRAEDVTVYSHDPVAMARQWQDRGAHYLHVVDLDGAFQGRPVHTELIRRITAALCIPVEVGGGVRDDDAIATLLDAGVSRVILGTRACENLEALRGSVTRFGGALAVSIDARDGLVQVRGWVETTGTRAVDLAQRVQAIGIATIIYTDTARDGMMAGPNLGAVSALCASVTCGVIASGGVTSPADLRALRALPHANLVGAIVGKALYEGTITLAEDNG